MRIGHLHEKLNINRRIKREIGFSTDYKAGKLAKPAPTALASGFEPVSTYINQKYVLCKTYMHCGVCLFDVYFKRKEKKKIGVRKIVLLTWQMGCRRYCT